MQKNKPPSYGGRDRPRAPNQEIADLLAAALLRLRTLPEPIESDATGGFLLAMDRHQSVHANPHENKGVQP